MSFWDIFRKREERASTWDLLPGAQNAPSGAFVQPRQAEQLATVYACVQAISSAIASIPCRVYAERPAGGRDEVVQHPLARLVRMGPNEHQSWPDFVEWCLAQVLLRGNALVEIQHEQGRVTGLLPIPWEWVSVQLLPGGRLVYDVTDAIGMYGGQGRMRRLLAGEVIHLRDRSDDGIVGRSRLNRAAATLASASDVQEAAAAFHRNGMQPSGALQHPGKLAEEQKAYLKRDIQKLHGGVSNRGSLLILDQGLTWQSLSISPEDAELLETRRFSVEELCRIFQVPPPLVQDYTHNTFTNSEQAGRWFAQFTIAPWCRKIEAAFNRALLDEQHHMEFDLSGFLRGDHAARWQANVAAVGAGILTVDEVREMEGWNPLQTTSATV